MFVRLQATFWWWLPACNTKCHRMCFLSTFYARGWPSKLKIAFAFPFKFLQSSKSYSPQFFSAHDMTTSPTVLTSLSEHFEHKITVYRRESPIYFTVTRFLLTELYISSCFVSLRQFSSATQSVLVYSGKCHRSHFLIKV